MTRRATSARPYHVGLHDGATRTGYKGAFIRGQDIVIPPLQPHHQILGMLQESPIIPGSAAFSTANTPAGGDLNRKTTLFFAGSVG